jgi:anti-sigma B factor antagonist
MADDRRGGGAQPAFEVDDLALKGVAGVAVRGEVELSTAPVLTAAVEARVRDSSGPFVIDLSEVDFLDSCGIHCLMRARALLARDDRALALVCPRENVRRVLQIVGVDTLFAIYDSRDELARGLERPG